MFAAQPELLAADFAVLLEPTDGWVEAGCQGVLVARAGFDGERAHAARPWMGRNAIHRASEVLARLAAHEADTVDVDGLAFRESFQVVGIEGGLADKHNVVPDRCTITVNRRFAPSYPPEEAEAQVRALLSGADDIEILQAQHAARAQPHQPVGRRLRAGAVVAGAAQVGLDRRRSLRVTRRARGQLRPR